MWVALSLLEGLHCITSHSLVMASTIGRKCGLVASHCNGRHLVSKGLLPIMKCIAPKHTSKDYQNKIPKE